MGTRIRTKDKVEIERNPGDYRVRVINENNGSIESQSVEGVLLFEVLCELRSLNKNLQKLEKTVKKKGEPTRLRDMV